MSKYKIDVTVNLVECDDETDDNPIELEDGRYQYTIVLGRLLGRSRGIWYL